MTIDRFSDGKSMEQLFAGEQIALTVCKSPIFHNTSEITAMRYPIPE